MDKFIIEGGRELNGEIAIQGAKNAILPLLAAAVLTNEKVTVTNVPRLIDVDNMIKILRSLGVSAEAIGDAVIVHAEKLTSYSIMNVLAKELRSSIFLLGAVLARKGRAIVAYPGGCDIGLRPIDIHIKALRDLGVEVEEKAGYIYCDGSRMTGGEVYFDYPSVGATENIILATIFSKGRTTVLNAAREPEITELQNFLNCMGAKIRGGGTSRIVIDGVEELHGCTYKAMPDRIAAGTYVIAAVMTGGEVALKGADLSEINSLAGKLSKNSCNISQNDGIIYIHAKGRPRAVEHVTTQPYPGFPTDLQAPFTALQTISLGTCVLTENIFENRFRHIPELRKMGANIITKDRTAIIRGVSGLVGAEVNAYDLRGGAALVLAGLAAHGTTVVNDVYHIDRGYESMEKVFTKLGADIIRV